MSNFIIDTNGKIKKDTIIALASDFHIDRTVNKERMKKLISNLLKLNPDYILILGDLIDNTKIDESILEYVYNLLICLTSVAPTYYIYGNHDFMAKSNLDSNDKWFEYYNWEYINLLNNISCFHLVDDKTITLPEKIDLTGIYFPYSYYEIDKESNDIYLDLVKEKLKNGFLKTFDANNYNILMQHSPNNIFEKRYYLDLLNMIREEFNMDVNFDFVISGHLHNGLVPSYISNIIPGNRGLIGLKGPDINLFADNCRGFKQITDTTSGVILPAISTFGADTFGENKVQKLNNLYPAKVYTLTLKR